MCEIIVAISQKDRAAVKRVSREVFCNDSDVSDDGSLSESEIQPKDRKPGPKSKTYKFRKVSTNTTTSASNESHKDNDGSTSKGNVLNDKFII